MRDGGGIFDMLSCIGDVVRCIERSAHEDYLREKRQRDYDEWKRKQDAISKAGLLRSDRGN